MCKKYVYSCIYKRYVRWSNCGLWKSRKRNEVDLIFIYFYGKYCCGFFLMFSLLIVSFYNNV